MGQLDEITSVSYRGLSIVTASMKEHFDKSSLPQVWDELRRKIAHYGHNGLVWVLLGSSVSDHSCGVKAFRKEVLDNVRDRRTLASAIIMGPLFGPMLFAFMINLSIERSLENAERIIELPVIGREHAPNLVRYLHSRNIDAIDGPADRDAALDAVAAGAHDVVLVIPEEFGERFAESVPARVEVIADRSNAQADREARPRVAILAANTLDGAICDLACLLHDIFVAPLNVQEDASTLAWICDRLALTAVVCDSPERLEKLLAVRERVRHPFLIYALHPCPRVGRTAGQVESRQIEARRGPLEDGEGPVIGSPVKRAPGAGKKRGEFRRRTPPLRLPESHR